MATTIENILGGGKKPAAQTPPATSPPPTPDKEGLKISDEEKKGVSPAQAMPTTKQTEPPQQPKRMSYEDMFKKLNPYQPPTEQELEKERKKQRREQIFAAIGDGISALSNLFFTTQYAPNMYSGRNTASQRTRERWDKLAAERNANMTAYINGLMRARQADDEYNANERAWERQLGLDKIKQERDKAADARAEEEHKWKKELHPFAKRKAEGDAQTAETQARYAEEYQKSRIRQNDAAAGASNASASASRSRARYYDRGGSGGSKSKDMQEAYDYWMSLTDEQKKQYRDWNNRYRKVRTGTDEYDRPVYSNQYMDDDDDFIQMVWNQRKGYLNSHINVQDYRRGGGTRQENSAPPLN